MSGELLTLANLGVDIFNLRKVAAIWKQMGQPSTDLPECAQVLHILNTICKIAAPSILLQTDASRTEYANSDKCHLIANRTQMSLSWEALATRNVQLLQLSLEKEQTLAGGHFVNYVRSNEVSSGRQFVPYPSSADLHKRGGNRTFLSTFPTHWPHPAQSTLTIIETFFDASTHGNLRAPSPVDSLQRMDLSPALLRV